MESNRKVILLASGLVFLSLSFFEFLPAGPWLDASFSRGMSGLLGLSFLYLSWFEFVFKESGVVPTIEKWNVRIFMEDRCCYWVCHTCLSWVSGNTGFGNFLPEPAPMLLMLIGLLVTYTGFYAYLVARGPLKNEEE